MKTVALTMDICFLFFFFNHRTATIYAAERSSIVLFFCSNEAEQALLFLCLHEVEKESGEVVVGTYWYWLSNKNAINAAPAHFRHTGAT